VQIVADDSDVGALLRQHRLAALETALAKA